MSALPMGIVTFVFTDIEGSSRLWERDRSAMARATARHDALLAEAMTSHDGVPFKHVGDMVQAAFGDPGCAVGAAVAAQRALAAEPWPETGPLRVRMGIHLGEAAPNAQGDYHQVPCLNRLARLLAAGHGGQVLLSDAVRQATAGRLPDGVTLLDLGRHRLRDLLESEPISQLAIAGLPVTFPPLKTLEGYATNLPILLTALIGRKAELAEIEAQLGAAETRLLTLTGPGGVGKTHLALQAAADLLDQFADGAWLVRLGEVSDPEMIVPTIAATLGVREGGGLGLREALLHWIDKKRLLLVIDNLEQVIVGAPAIAGLLTASPHLQILGTSRQRLGIGGERVMSVQPLPVASNPAPGAPDAQSPAVQLFVARARDVAPGLPFHAPELETIAAICARLDGLPLAIELAAAQLRTRSLPELLADLERRFDLLVGGRREALSHQQSLAATIAWSYERLSAEEQRLLRLLSTFAGGCSREAAQEVAADIPDVSRHLGSLSEQSLIRRATLPHGESRWSLLESIRAFARGRLDEVGEGAAAHAAHAAWCLAFATAAASHLAGAEQESWLDRVDLEHDNARAALRWCAAAGEREHGLRLATALAPFWQTRGQLSEGRRWLEGALAAGDPASQTELPALVEAGILAQLQGDYPGAAAWFHGALEAARRHGDRGREAALLNNLGAVALEQGALSEGERRFSEALALAQSLGDARRQADALGNLGTAAHYAGNTTLALERYLGCLAIMRQLGDRHAEAEMLLNVLLLLAPLAGERDRARAAGVESLRRFRALGDPRGEAYALSGLGLAAAVAGDLQQAADYHEASFHLAERIEDRATMLRALGNLGSVEIERGNYPRATELLGRLLRGARDLGDQDGLAHGLELFAALLAADAVNELAARLLGAAAALRDRIGAPLHPEARDRHAATVAALRHRLGVRYDELASAGAGLSPDAAIVAALSCQARPAPDGPLAESLQTLDDLLKVAAGGAAEHRGA